VHFKSGLHIKNIRAIVSYSFSTAYTRLFKFQSSPVCLTAPGTQLKLPYLSHSTQSIYHASDSGSHLPCSCLIYWAHCQDGLPVYS